MPPKIPAQTNGAPPPYLRIWRWHFYAGLLLSPTLAALAVTGLVYLFKPQAEPALYRKWLEVPVQTAQVSAQAQLEAARRAYPDYKVQSVQPSPGPGRSLQAFLKSPDGEPVTVYVNPHDGSIAGAQRSDRTLMQLAHDIHGSLLLGKPGEIAMELTAGWAFILVATGLYLWWPGKRENWGGVFWPRLSAPGRSGWRDLHAVPAFYLSGLILLFLSTGIPWTGITGKWISGFANRTGLGSPPGFGGSPYRSSPIEGGSPATLDALVQIARERLPAGAAYQVIPPRTPGGAAVLRWKAPRPQDRAYIHVDMSTGKVLADYRWKDFGWIGKATLMSVALHEGTWFGPWNQALNSLVALGVLGLAFSGIVMAWKRRPPGAFLSAPEAPESSRLPWSLGILMGLFGMMVPVAGLSLLGVWLIEQAVLRFRRNRVSASKIF